MVPFKVNLSSQIKWPHVRNSALATVALDRHCSGGAVTPSDYALTTSMFRAVNPSIYIGRQAFGAISSADGYAKHFALRKFRSKQFGGEEDRVGESMHSIRVSLWWCRALALAVTLVVGDTASSTAAESSSTDASTLDVEWPVNGKDQVILRIPRAYALQEGAAGAMERHVYPEGRPHDANAKDMIIDALWPDLAPNSEAIYHETGVSGGGKLMMALLHSQAIRSEGSHTYNKLRIAFDVAVNMSTNMLCIPQQAASPGGQSPPARCYKRDRPDVKPPEYGLSRIGVDFQKNPDIPEVWRRDISAQDIYYAGDPSGELQTVILCTAEEVKTSKDGPQYHAVPQCEEEFIEAQLNALVSIQYRRVYLPEWRNIEASWRKLLGSFVVHRP